MSAEGEGEGEGEVVVVRAGYDPLGDSPTNYRREGVGVHPSLDFPAYKSTQLRFPRQPLVYLPHTVTEVTGPRLSGVVGLKPSDSDLTVQGVGEPLGERIIVSGRVYDTEGKPLRDTLVEVWQANASGRYAHRWDRWAAPLDPNFHGAGRCVTDDDGRYEFTSIRPGAYPWGNHYNAWRPAHIHFSLLGRAFTQRLVTQMYFPGDPFFAFDPIFNSVRDERARNRMVSSFNIHETRPNWAQAFNFDIYLRGPAATPFEESF
jgi:protocatechuate 3,4-dioxygenase, beta subunit